MSVQKRTEVEWESTISVSIDKKLFDRVLMETKEKKTTDASGGRSGTTTTVDVIFSFNNGSRLSSRTAQRKVVTEKKLVLGFSNGRFYPIHRTRATEETTSIDSTLSVDKAVHRLILPDRAAKRDGYKLRMAYNKEEIEEGVRYTFTCEAEYANTSTYEEILDYEQCLMQHLADHMSEDQLAPDKLTLGEIFSCVVPKVQIWNCFNPQDRYVWAYKWNGVKAKFMCIDGQAYIWPDAGSVYTKPCRGDLSFVDRMCLQVELMEDVIVIVEVVAAAYSSQIHTAEPLTNVAVLDYLNAVLYGSSTVGEKPLVVQKFYECPLPKCFDDTKYDGFIIVQKDLTIKWKPPTVDVKCVGPYEYEVGCDKEKTVIRLPALDDEGRLNVAGVKGRIYELSPDFKVLRQRLDRITCSTSREYQIFLDSVQLMMNTV